MKRIGVTMPVLQAPLERVPEYARLADEAGLYSAWDYEFFRNPFVMLAAAAPATKRIKLATGIATAFSRTPFELASAAADIDELSRGRAILGIGTGAPEFLYAFHGTDAAAPVPRLREYVAAVRRAWEFLHTGESTPLQGEHYPMPGLPLNPWGARGSLRPQIPIYLAAMRPKLTELAGEVADGLLVYLQTPEFITQVSRPRVAAGAARAGRDVDDIEIASMVVCSISEDRTEALRRARLQVGMYVAHPVGDAVVRFHGFEREQMKLREAVMSEGVGALERVTDDALVETFSICGTPAEARRQLSRYADVPHLILHTPYVPPLTVEDTEDAFRCNVDTFGEIAASLDSGRPAKLASASA